MCILNLDIDKIRCERLEDVEEELTDFGDSLTEDAMVRKGIFRRFGRRN